MEEFSANKFCSFVSYNDNCMIGISVFLLMRNKKNDLYQLNDVIYQQTKTTIQ